MRNFLFSNIKGYRLSVDVCPNTYIGTAGLAATCFETAINHIHLPAFRFYQTGQHYPQKKHSCDANGTTIGIGVLVTYPDFCLFDTSFSNTFARVLTLTMPVLSEKEKRFRNGYVNMFTLALESNTVTALLGQRVLIQCSVTRYCHQHCCLILRFPVCRYTSTLTSHTMLKPSITFTAPCL